MNVIIINIQNLIKTGCVRVSFENKRLSVDNHFINFIESKEDLLEKFSMFEKVIRLFQVIQRKGSKLGG